MTVTEIGRTATDGGAAAEEARLRRELAAVYRLIAHFKMTDLIYNHISVRLPGPEHRFLLNPFGLLYEEVTASNLVIVGLDGQLITDGRWKVNPAGFVIHSAIHEAREDALCVLHTHTKAGCAVAAQEHGLLPLNQMSLEFYNRVAYHDYEGIALSNAEKSRLVADLGTKPVMILRNHGLLTVGKTPGEAFLRMFYLERSCEIQVEALAGGAPVITPPPEVCEYTARQFEGAPSHDEYSHDDYSNDAAPNLAWDAMLRLVERLYPDYKD
jgi:ribulose-5-phosphate 4-epimerase/fuculose-1-phosphate aldolase